MSVKKRKESYQIRAFNEKLNLDYFIWQQNNQIHFMICMQPLFVNKQYNVKQKYTTFYGKSLQDTLPKKE